MCGYGNPDSRSFTVLSTPTISVSSDGDYVTFLKVNCSLLFWSSDINESTLSEMNYLLSSVNYLSDKYHRHLYLQVLPWLLMLKLFQIIQLL